MSRPALTDQAKKDQTKKDPPPAPIRVPPGGRVVGRLVLDKEGFVVGTIS